MAIRQKAMAKTSKHELDARPLFMGKALPQVHLEGYDVFTAALERIRWIFDEFDGKVAVSNSGGKDSTIVIELAAMVAKERGELPLNVYWLDQECEFEATVDYQRYIMYERDDLKFHWYQIPFELENSTNQENPWLNVWGEGEEWVRDREPNSIHENTFGQTRWYGLLDSIAATDWNGWAILDGIRGEESPARRLVSRSKPVYKWVTWSVGAGGGSKKKPNTGIRFHPIHDWTFTDVWKAIHDNNWAYNAHYDHLHQYGVKYRAMRVSNYHHESALKSLFFLQEIEPDTWEAATRRLAGISTYGHLKTDQYPKDLPYMFASWTEYMHYLIDHLAKTDENRDIFRAQFTKVMKVASDIVTEDEIAQLVIKNVIGNDLYGTHINNYLVGIRSYRQQMLTFEEGRRRFLASQAEEGVK